eukprot:scaffold6299_cov107-Cylindrotheca_fusiformis.AAC.3
MHDLSICFWGSKGKGDQPTNHLIVCPVHWKVLSSLQCAILFRTNVGQNDGRDESVLSRTSEATILRWNQKTFSGQEQYTGCKSFIEFEILEPATIRFELILEADLLLFG